MAIAAAPRVEPDAEVLVGLQPRAALPACPLALDLTLEAAPEVEVLVEDSEVVCVVVVGLVNEPSDFLRVEVVQRGLGLVDAAHWGAWLGGVQVPVEGLVGWVVIEVGAVGELFAALLTVLLRNHVLILPDLRQSAGSPDLLSEPKRRPRILLENTAALLHLRRPIKCTVILARPFAPDALLLPFPGL